ncbi:MAG: ABC transporter permease, partial [Pseudomonadota bacterium]
RGARAHETRPTLAKCLRPHASSHRAVHGNGLMVKDPESTNTASFLIVFPLTFASNIFVPVETMPGWLQAIVNNQPMTHAVNSTRAFLVTGEGYDAVWKLAIWMAAILIIFVPLATRKYREAE